VKEVEEEKRVIWLSELVGKEERKISRKFCNGKKSPTPLSQNGFQYFKSCQ
jgi:hypothetical protein